MRSSLILLAQLHLSKLQLADPTVCCAQFQTPAQYRGEYHSGSYQIGQITANHTSVQSNTLCHEETCARNPITEFSHLTETHVEI